MAGGKLFIILAILVYATAEFNHEIETENEASKAVAPKKEQKPRTAHAGRDRGSLKKLNNLLNKTDDALTRRRIKDKVNKIQKLNMKHRADHYHMLNDNEGAIAINQKTMPDNDTNSLTDKINVLRKYGPTYEAETRNSYLPLVTGVFCDFEIASNRSSIDMCMWQWNDTVSKFGLGFSVVTAADIVAMNKTTRELMFAGPSTDSDDNETGHFLYLPVDPSMGSMAIKSPVFRGLWEYCKFEVRLHQSKMQNASIRLISESTAGMQWILQEFAGNNLETWHVTRFIIGKVQQEVRIIIEITKPSNINLMQPLPHIAIDGIRMIDCLHEPPVYNGECKPGQLKCKSMNVETCIKMQQVCDLVKDCDDGSDEHQSCDKMPFGSYCNFERGSCGFENIPQPVLKWALHSGPTPTAKTGPNYDHTCGPRVTSSVPAPPLTPAHRNHSLASCVGYYYYVNMNMTGPNQKKADFASIAVLKSVVFNPPPRVHGNISSKYYNCCMIRFYYQQNGRNYGSLGVEVVELTSRGNITTALWFSSKDKGEFWFRAMIFLPNITNRYYVQFKTRMGMRIYSDSAIDDFSMAPECYGLNIDPEELGGYNYYDPVFEEKTTPHEAYVGKTYYRFTPCGATGRYGPNQTMCDIAYANTSVSVKVVHSPPFHGIQVWEVPEEGLYTIIASGAAGGFGSAWAGVSHATQVRGLFELHKGEQIYMLIGQQGLNSCKKTLSAQESQECSRRSNETTQMFTSKTHEVRNTQVLDGGGGGGGATYVLLIAENNKPYPLMVGGGGGGISVGIFRDDSSQHAHGLTNSTPESGYMYGDPGRTSGAGGGWYERSGPITPGFEELLGGALVSGAVGGRACVGGAHGGYGGGGGGCLKGGGGGGWMGGTTNQGEHGGGGYSYIDPKRSLREYTVVEVAKHMSPGEVVIIPSIYDCGCDYRCVALNEYRSAVQCYCPDSWHKNANDPTLCTREEEWEYKSVVVICVISMLAVLFIIPTVGMFLFMYNKYQKRREAEVHRKRLVEQELQLHRLRNPPGGNDNALTAFNPHYGSDGFLPQGIDVRGLPQVSRESLKLVKALGQGAFGEVYQGLYKYRNTDSVQMPVAVKTLPELSTGQAESDFLMEAAIMAKFNHPNIVHLIGVCFDRHPRFIVLELLAGGDLKNFLRESRPKPERASALNMKDLLLCAIDVCKGCRYLEAKRFIHRDIAARNCLLTSRGPGRVVKIADFGMARDIYRSDYYKKGGKAMLPIKWMPPEAYIDGVFTTKTDVWSFGVLIWEVFSLGVMPYTGCANREVMEMVSGGGRLEKPHGCSQEIYRLMCECWNPTPADRPTFTHMYDRLSVFLQDPEIVGAPLPAVRALFPPTEGPNTSNGSQRATPACDYLVPMTPPRQPSEARLTVTEVHHSKSPTGAQDIPDNEDSHYQHHPKASQDYGNIQPGTSSAARGSGEVATSCGNPTRSPNTKFLPSNSTDRLLSSVDDASNDDMSPETEPPTIWETSFMETAVIEPVASDAGPAVEKLISITPTSPKPPDNALTKAIEAHVIDKTNHTNALAPDRRGAPIASPDPPRINAWSKEPPIANSKPKTLLLDAAQLEQNLNALKKNSGSVNLTTMNILPPYINVVTPNKLSDSKTIQIDPKKAVIYDLQLSKDNAVDKEPENKLKPSKSASSLINGPMTDVPYADSDNASSSSGGNLPNHVANVQKSNQNNYSEVKIGKVDVKNKLNNHQGSNGGESMNESEISC